MAQSSQSGGAMRRVYAIVGSGAAGMAAAERLRELDPAGQILLISEEREGYYSRPGLAYLLTGHIPERQLYPYARAELRALGLHFVHGHVQSIDARAHVLALEGGKQLRYDRLLLAVGARAVRPALDGINLQGVVTLDNIADARRILRLARRARRAVVIGGGITALEIAEGLAARGIETHYLLRRDRYWSSVLDEVESRLVEARLHAEGLILHHRTEVLEIHARRGRVASVQITGGKQIACQILGIAIGIRPRLELAQTAGLATERGVLVDDRLRTSAPDIFAAGDVAQVFDPVSGEHKLDSLWWVAVDQGRAAAENLAGGERAYRKAMAMNVTRIGGLTTTIIGSVGGRRVADEDLISIARGDSERWREAPKAHAVLDRTAGSRLRILVGKDHLEGALVMGDQSLSRPLQDLVTHNVNITPIRGQLLRSDVDIAALIEGYWERWKEETHASQS